MTFLTSNELNFLTDLGTSWRLLYLNEFARLLREADGARGARYDVGFVAPRLYASERSHARPGAKILAFTPQKKGYRRSPSL
jgi:hypothetical protein